MKNDYKRSGCCIVYTVVAAGLYFHAQCLISLCFTLMYGWCQWNELSWAVTSRLIRCPVSVLVTYVLVMSRVIIKPCSHTIALLFDGYVLWLVFVSFVLVQELMWSVRHFVYGQKYSLFWNYWSRVFNNCVESQVLLGCDFEREVTSAESPLGIKKGIKCEKGYCSSEAAAAVERYNETSK